MNKYCFTLLTLSLILLIPLSTNIAFADQTVQTDEYHWTTTFEFDNVEINQDTSNLHNLIIKTKVSSNGLVPIVSANIYADIVSPTGVESMPFGKLWDLNTGESDIVRLNTGIVEEGTYVINLRVTSVGEYTAHVFDTYETEYTVAEHGFEKSVETIGNDNDAVTTYQPEYSERIQYFEALHASINLAEINEFEKIIVTDKGFRQDF